MNCSFPFLVVRIIKLHKHLWKLVPPILRYVYDRAYGFFSSFNGFFLLFGGSMWQPIYKIRYKIVVSNTVLKDNLIQI